MKKVFRILKPFSEMLIYTFDDEKRRIFFDTLYNLVKQTNARTLTEFNADKKKNTIAMIKAVKGVDSDTRKFVIKAFFSLFLLAPKAYKNIRASIRSNRKSKKLIKLK